jgi:hypothetical protein
MIQTKPKKLRRKKRVLGRKHTRIGSSRRRRSRGLRNGERNEISDGKQHSAAFKSKSCTRNEQQKQRKSDW